MQPTKKRHRVDPGLADLEVMRSGRQQAFSSDEEAEGYVE